MSGLIKVCDENETEFLISETKRLRAKYPKVLIAPLFYKVEEHMLYLLEADRNNNLDLS